MKWLRRLIPWAFEHDWETNHDSQKMQLIDGRSHNFLVCRRCGARSELFEAFNRHGYVIRYYRRGCKGRP